MNKGSLPVSSYDRGRSWRTPGGAVAARWARAVVAGGRPSGETVKPGRGAHPPTHTRRQNPRPLQVRCAKRDLGRTTGRVSLHLTLGRWQEPGREAAAR